MKSPTSSLAFNSFIDTNQCADLYSSLSSVDHIELIHQHLIDTIRLSSDADVPTACLVSGGIDSSLIASHTTSQNIHYYSSQPTFACAESELVPSLESSLGVTVNYISQKSITFDDFHRVLLHQYEPFGDLSCLAIDQLLSTISSDGIRVVLSGTGADELFFGYPQSKLPYLAHQILHSPIALLLSLNIMNPVILPSLPYILITLLFPNYINHPSFLLLSIFIQDKNSPFASPFR